MLQGVSGETGEVVMKTPRIGVCAIAIAFFLAIGARLTGHPQEQKIESRQREIAGIMLSDVHDALKKKYYDPTFRGLDIDARYKAYEDRLKKVETLGEAFRTVAAYLSGLGDSHTFFLPPRRTYRVDYGFRLQVFGDACYITELRPESDAAHKLHRGDQVLTLDGFSVNRKDLWQLEYYLQQIDPKLTSEFTLRAPSGTTRKEQVLTKYVEGKLLKDLTIQGGLNDNYNLMFEEEKQRHLLRQRHTEQDDVMIWKMPAFNMTESEVDHMIGLARKHKSLILDLRGNPGGYVSTLDRVVGSFFDHEVKIAAQVTRKSTKPQVAKSRGKDIFTGGLFVLVDSGSASAAELFARVIQLEHRGTILGDRSSGSVMESILYPFHAGVDIQVFYGASITEADLIMADGKSLEKTGVTPDMIILPTAAQLAEGQDPVLAKAAELAGIKLDPAAAGKLFPFEWAPLS